MQSGAYWQCTVSNYVKPGKYRTYRKSYRTHLQNYRILQQRQKIQDFTGFTGSLTALNMAKTGDFKTFKSYHD